MDLERSKNALYSRHLCDEVWYHGYHVSWTRQRGTGGPTISQSTRPKGTGQEALNPGGLEDNYRIESYK
jgi:hypothetical protein